MIMCYACRRDIDSLSTRCPYCTSEVEPYSGLRPKQVNNLHTELPRQITQSENTGQVILAILIAGAI